jgi:dTDP-glucose 4,6-dehydratase
MQMKLLVTGGLGFIGSNFIRLIHNKHPDWEITNIDKMGIGSNPASLYEIENDNNYIFIKGDICNLQLLNKVIHNVDAVVHMAAETHVDRSIADPNIFLQNNTIGTFSLLEVARKHNHKVKIVQVSTDEVYGQALEGSFAEDTPPNPSNPYSASKAAADMYALAYHRTFGTKVCITRCTNNFGPFQLPEKLIPKTIIRAQRNLSIPVYGSGKNIRDWIYVVDHCEAIETVLNRGESGEVYNISSENEVQNVDLVRIILSQMGKSETLIDYVEDRPGHDTRYSLNAKKIKSALGWKPKYEFKDALAKTVNWYLENEKWWRFLATDKNLHPTPWKLRGSN